MKSVSSQTSKSFEHIIIDGKSQDNTLEIVKRYNHKLQIISESDKGLYDAMNKGVSLSSGDFVLFLNSGDFFSDQFALQNIIEGINNSSNYDIYVFNTYLLHQNKLRVFNRINLSKYWKAMPFSHQAMIIKRDVALTFPYNLQYKIAADYNFIYECISNSVKFSYFDEFIVTATAGGVSDIRRFSATWERYKVLTKHKFNLKFFFYYTYLMLDQLVRYILKIFLPKSIIQKIILKKYE